MRKNKILNRLVIIAIATLMCLSVGPIAVNATTGDTCSDPYIVTIPYSVSHTTNGFANDYYSTTMGYYDEGPDTIYRIVIASTTAITVTCTPVGTYQYAGIGLFAGCPDTNPTALIYSTTSNGPVSFVYTCSPGTYYLMVDNWPSPAYITYTLTITGGIQPGDDCAHAITAVAGINSASKQPIWYQYTPTQACTLEITSNNLGQSIDTYLYVYDACGGNLMGSMDDDNSGYYNYASTVSFAASAGVSYKIFWDDYWGTSAFLFKITEITGCDVGVTSILHPISGDGPGAITPQVYVSSFLPGSPTCDVHMNIYQGQLGADFYNNNFDSDNGGLTVSGDEWQWGTPSYGLYSAYSIPYCWGTNLGGYYNNNANAKLTTGPIDISGADNANLQFYLWYYSESYWDGMNVKISTDGTNFNILGSYLNPYNEDAASTGNAGIPGETCWSGSGMSWQLVTFDLSSYISAGTVWLRFHFGSDSSVNSYYGFFIDNLHVYQTGATTPIWTGNSLSFSAPGYCSTWTPATFTPPASGIYSVVAWTTASCDDESTNDKISTQVLLGTIDAGVEIVFPTPLMGPVPFAPLGNVTNYGDVNLPECPVHCWIDTVPELVFSESFEVMGSINAPNIPAKILFDPVKENTEAGIKIEWQGDPGFGDVNDWTIYDSGDATSYWHQEDNRASSGTYSMQDSNPTDHGAGYYSYDWLISPPINVGTGGYVSWDMWAHGFQYAEGYQEIFIGNSADGNNFYGAWNTVGTGGSWASFSQNLYPAYIAPDGTTYIAFYAISYYGDTYTPGVEGPYVDNVQVYSGGTVYDETIYVDVDVATGFVPAVFPTFTPKADKDYVVNMCTEQPYDEVPANDCDVLTFNTGAPVYILETGAGFNTIPEGIAAATDGQTVVVTNGTYYGDILLDKPITLTGEWIDSTLDKATCTWDHNLGSFIVGTVDIIGAIPVAPPEPCDCDYQICLYDYYGDGWNGGTLDVIVDGVTVLDGITLASGYGPVCYTFTVQTDSTIQVVWTAGSWPSENYYYIYDSEGNVVVSAWYPYYDGTWSGTGTCPPCVDYDAIQTVFQKFDVNPPNTFTSNDAAVHITGINVLVQQNNIHSIRGMVDQSTGIFTIKGVHIYGGDPVNLTSNIIVQNNSIYDILNENATGGVITQTLLSENFEGVWGPYGNVPPAGWTIQDFGSSPGVWNTNDWYKYNYGGTQLNVARVYYSPIENQDERLISPSVNCGIAASVHLKWWNYISSLDTGYVEVSNNGGSTWTIVKSFISTGNYGQIWDIDISPQAAGYSNVQVRFRYVDYDGFYWNVDDVSIYITYTVATPYGGADGVSVQGFLGEIAVLDNSITDIHSAGWCYGVEYTPTNIAPPPTLEPCDDITYVDFHDGYTENGLGLTSGGTCTEAIQFTDAELADYRDSVISEITVAIGCDDYGAEPGIAYKVWMQPTQPSDPTTANFVATGTSGSSVWNTIVLDTNYEIPDTGDLWVGVLYVNHPSGAYPMGFDQTTTSPDRAGYLWDAADGWLTLGGIGYPGVWGLGIGMCAGGGGGGAAGAIVVNCNYFTQIGENAEVWNHTGTAPYPGIMFSVDQAPIPGPANASLVTLKCNYFDNGCLNNAYAVINKDLMNPLDATLNYWGQVDGPDSDTSTVGYQSGSVQDPVTGYIADGRGANIVNYGQVMFDPWVGVHAIIAEPMTDPVSAVAGEPVTFDATGSYAYCFPTCEDCCDAQPQAIQYLWDFDDGFYSANKVAMHVFDQPGTYHVILQVDSVGFPFHNNFMFDYAYITVNVVESSAPFTANADGGNLGGYEATLGIPVTLTGTATGGKAPYFYTWDFGDGTSTQTSSRSNTIQHVYRETGTYTVTLTVIDWNGDRTTDTSTVTVNDIEEMIVNIGGNTNVAQGDQIRFTSTVSGGTTPYTYSWNFGDGIISNSANPTHIFENSGTYTVSLTVTDSLNKQETKTKTVTVTESAEISEVEIKDVKGGLGVKATVVSQASVDWSIQIKGRVFLGGSGNGVAQGGITQIKLPFTIALGNVGIRITAGTEVKQYTAAMFGPLVLNLKEA